MVKNQSKRNGAGRSGKSAKGNMAAANPLPYQVNPTHTRRFRFVGSIATEVGGGTGTVLVTRGCLLSLLAVQSGAGAAQTSVTFIPIIGGIRLRSVEIWQNPNTLGSAPEYASVGLEWLSDTGKPSKTVRTVLSSIASSFRSSPPPLSRAAAWSSWNGTTTVLEEPLFELTIDPIPGQSAAVQAVIVDITADVIITNETASRIAVTCTATTNPLYQGIFGLPLNLLSRTNTIGPLTLNPVGLPNGLVDSGGAQIVASAITRTN